MRPNTRDWHTSGPSLLNDCVRSACALRPRCGRGAPALADAWRSPLARFPATRPAKPGWHARIPQLLSFLNEHTHRPNNPVLCRPRGRDGGCADAGERLRGSGATRSDHSNFRTHHTRANGCAFGRGCWQCNRCTAHRPSRNGVPVANPGRISHHPNRARAGVAGRNRGCQQHGIRFSAIRGYQYELYFRAS